MCQWGGREPPELAQFWAPRRAVPSRSCSCSQLPSEGSQPTGSPLPWAVPHRSMLCLVGGTQTPPVLSEVVPSMFCAARAKPGAPGRDAAPWDGGLGGSRAEVPGCGHQVLPGGTKCGCGKAASALLVKPTGLCPARSIPRPLGDARTSRSAPSLSLWQQGKRSRPSWLPVVPEIWGAL